MKSLKALIWSCCISVLPSSSPSQWRAFRFSSSFLFSFACDSPSYSPCVHLWVSSLVFASQPSDFHAYLSPSYSILYVMLPHLPLGVLPRSPSSTRSHHVLPVTAPDRNAASFCYCWWCLNLTAWYSNNVMKFNIYCTMIKLKVMHKFNK